MALFRNIAILLAVTEATAEAVTGDKRRVLPNDGDNVTDSVQAFRVFFDATQADGADSPTTDVLLETSHDGESWVKVAASTQLTADGEAHEFAEVTALGPWVRARSALGGVTPPNHTATVVLASTAPFRLTAK